MVARENVSTGYRWQFESDGAELLADSFLDPPQAFEGYKVPQELLEEAPIELVGAGRMHVWLFRRIQKGTLSFHYLRSFESKKPLRTVLIEVE